MGGLTAAKADLCADVATAAGQCGIGSVWDHEPLDALASATTAMSVFTAAVTPDAWHFAVRLYITAQLQPAEAQQIIDDTIDQFFSHLSARWGPERWDIEPPGDLPCWTATAVIEVPRGFED